MDGIDCTLVDDGDPGGDPPEVDLEATVERKDDHVLGWAEHRRESISRTRPVS